MRPQIKVIALLNPADELRAQALLDTDLAGCLFEHEINEALLDGIRAVANRGEWVSRALAKHLWTQALNPTLALDPTHLSKREQKILALLARGCDNARIAAELHLADHTVRNYVSHVCQKLGMDRQTIEAHFRR
ncbi:MAG: LuxR C-terminal-related transcriptional regulator [Caldilineaceae bacterium]